MSFIERASSIYLKLMKAGDTPHHIALGFAIGIFYGLIPFVGVIFTILTALLFKANKVSALIGCFVTNTWMSAALILPSIRIGAKLFGLNWQNVWRGKLIIPSLVGFIIIALVIAVVGYFISLFFVLEYRNRKHEGD